MSSAGASAQQEHDRRRAKERAARRRNLPLALLLVVTLPILAYHATFTAVDWFNQWGERAFSGEALKAGDSPGPKELLTPDLARMLAFLAATGMAVTVARWAWGRRRTTEAWSTGAAGERRTAALLAPLERKGWVVIHDRRIPGSRANIDHIAIGPTGVYVIESKNWTGRVVIRSRSLTHNGHRADQALAQTEREAEAVRVALTPHLAALGLGVGVVPIVCIHRARVERRPFWARTVIDGVVICSGRRLRELLRRGPVVLSAEAIATLAGATEQALRPVISTSTPSTRSRRSSGMRPRNRA